MAREFVIPLPSEHRGFRIRNRYFVLRFLEKLAAFSVFLEHRSKSRVFVLDRAGGLRGASGSSRRGLQPPAPFLTSVLAPPRRDECMGMTNDGLSYWQAEATGEPLLESTIGDLLDRRAEEYATREAVVYSCYPEFGGALDIRWTFQQYRDQANAVAKGLMAVGLKKGDHIAVWAANLPEWPLLQMAAAKAGLVLVTVNPVLRGAEIEYILRQGDIRALFFMAQIRDHNCLETMRGLTTPGATNGEVTSERLPMLRYLCLVGAPPAGLLEQSGWRPTMFREMVGGGMAISSEALAERQASVKHTDPAMMLYTSGTTGFPKGALLTHYNLINQSMTVASRLNLDQGSHACVMVPFFHVFGCVGYTLANLYLAGTIHPLLAYDPVKAMQVISTERCNFSGGVPTMLLAMLQHPDFGKYDLSSLTGVVCAGAPVPVALMEQVKERIGADRSEEHTS